MAALCLLVQVISATFVVRDFESPNAASAIARNLARDSAFVYDATGGRAYHLPGEPIYLAAGFRFLPESSWRYLHAPIVVLLVTAITASAFAIGGPALAMTTGGVASLEPFLVAHGPVWDDIVLATALQWSVFAMLLFGVAKTRATSRGRAALWLAAAACSAGAAITRLESQVVLALVAAAVIALKSARSIRPLGWAIAVGVVAALVTWGLRNEVTIGHFLVGTTHDGKTLDESTGPWARAAILQNGQAGGSGDTVVTAGGEWDADQQRKQVAWRYISEHPADFVKTAGLKLFVGFLGIDLGRSATSARNLIALGTSIVLLILGPAGLRTLQAQAATASASQILVLLLGMTTLGTLVLMTLGPVGLRYRFGLTTFLYLGTAASLLRMTSMARHAA